MTIRDNSGEGGVFPHSIPPLSDYKGKKKNLKQKEMQISFILDAKSFEKHTKFGANTNFRTFSTVLQTNLPFVNAKNLRIHKFLTTFAEVVVLNFTYLNQWTYRYSA